MICGLAAIGLLAAACTSEHGDGEGQGNSNNPWGITARGPGVLSVSPLDPSTLVSATPLGKLAPPGHVLPTDHVYLSFVNTGGSPVGLDCHARPVYAAGAGVVNFVLQTEAAGDTKVMVQMTQDFYYYYDHVLLLAGIGVGSRVAAGEQIATTTGRCPSIDLGSIDLTATLPGLVKPERYGEFGAHAVSPYRYMSAELQALYYPKVIADGRTPVDKDGRIDWGKAGTLAGDWFHASLAAAPASTLMGPDGWTKTLSFAYDWIDRTPRISIGGTFATPGVVTIDAADPDFLAVTPALGTVVFRTTQRLGGLLPSGWMLVRMIGDERLRVEYFPGATTAPADFTVAAQEYVR